MKTRSQDAEFESSFTLLKQIRWCFRLQETHRKFNICILTHGKENRLQFHIAKTISRIYIHNVCIYRSVYQYREKGSRLFSCEHSRKRLKDAKIIKRKGSLELRTPEEDEWKSVCL